MVVEVAFLKIFTVVPGPSFQEYAMKKKKLQSRGSDDFPPTQNPPGHGPHVIDWGKVEEAIRNMPKEEVEALIQASRGDSGGID